MTCHPQETLKTEGTRQSRGTINFFQTHIGAWEDDVTPAVQRRLRALLGYLAKRRGFHVQRDPEVARLYPTLAGLHYIGRKGDLEFTASVSGRMFEIEFFQNVTKDNPNGGQYDFDKFRRMPRTMQLQCAVELSHVLRKLLSMGYALDGRRQGIASAHLLAVLRHAQGRSDDDPLAAFNRRWNFASDWDRGGRFERDASGWPSAKEYRVWRARDRDGQPIVSGENWYCRRRGRLFRGTARPNMNDMWILISHGECVYVSAREMFQCDPSQEPRRFVPNQLQRLEVELDKAVKNKLFRRVASLARAAASAREALDREAV